MPPLDETLLLLEPTNPHPSVLKPAKTLLLLEPTNPHPSVLKPAKTNGTLLELTCTKNSVQVLKVMFPVQRMCITFTAPICLTSVYICQ